MKVCAGVFGLWVAAAGVAAGEQFLANLLDVVKPVPGESPWREIAWLTDVTEARRAAMEQGKPLAIFTAADGSPLGRT